MTNIRALITRANVRDHAVESVIPVDLAGHTTIGIRNIKVDEVFRREDGEGAQQAVWIISVVHT